MGYSEKNGIPVDDVEWVNLNADEAVGPMMSGDLSAAYMYEPWITNVVENALVQQVLLIQLIQIC